MTPTEKKYTVAIIAGQLVVGGAESQLYLWLSNLDRSKFEPVVITLHPGYQDYWESRIEALNIPLILIYQESNPLIRLVKIIQTLKLYNPALVQGWHSFASIYAGLAAKALGAKSLGGVRGSFQYFRKSWVQFLMSFCIDAVLANSSYVADQIRKKRKIRKIPVYTVQNAIVIPKTDRNKLREQMAQKLNLSNDIVWIGSTGRLDANKRFEDILRALALLRNEVDKFHFLLIGDGNERSRLETLVTELDLVGYVTFLGQVPDARNLLSIFDIFCFASVDEGLPNVVMEAAAASLPVVSWKFPFIEELLQNDLSAALAEPGNLLDFKNAILALINSQELRKRLGSAGYDHMLAEFSLDRYIQKMTYVYNELLESRS